MAERIGVLDTTLRDGVQGEGVVFSREDKIKVLRALDALGVEFIEAGNPAASPRDRELFAYVSSKMTLKNARLPAFGATCRAGGKAEADEGLRALIECGAKTVSLFGKASRFQAEAVLKCDPQENLRIIRDSVSYLTGAGLTVFFDGEHFFDGYSDDPDYALQAMLTARDAGASVAVLCDTNGGALPDFIARATEHAVRALAMPVSIHCHDDAGLATAGTLAAVAAGATQVQGTVNGYGERCGNANLCQVIPNLVLKMGKRCLPEGALARLTGTARLISEIANLSMNERSPYVGRSAFAHKGGMHIDGMLKNPRTFEHIDPESVGNRRRYLLSEMAGRGALMTRLHQLAPELSKDSEATARILEMLKTLEGEGYSFEDAEESLRLRVLGALGKRRRFFEVLDFHVVSRKPEDDKNAQAFVKVRVDGQTEITADEGDGPVNALDLALRKALARFYPSLFRMRLRDFKVRVVSAEGTASSVRVFIESTDGEKVWSTVGVSSNIIEASFIALTDSIEYLLMRETDDAGRRNP